MMRFSFLSRQVLTPENPEYYDTKVVNDEIQILLIRYHLEQYRNELDFKLTSREDFILDGYSKLISSEDGKIRFSFFPERTFYLDGNRIIQWQVTLLLPREELEKLKVDGIVICDN